MDITPVRNDTTSELIVYDQNWIVSTFQPRPRQLGVVNNRLEGVLLRHPFGWVHRCMGDLIFVQEGSLCHRCGEGYAGKVRRDGILKRIRCWWLTRKFRKDWRGGQ